ncbi:AsmA family protein [Inmirania thermothiophila]|uniref:AsmA protein n=1 Tax=Inmirania thermothiophila TaxID=1750597 RepID=A0A3N1Y7A0_9GAMM|nr:AsmA family protein [Inmirania thermothiophila]ROR34630.1 AsmA protein [Inmirania thermothiophila]
MRVWLRRIGIALGVLVVLFAAVLGYVAATFDPDDYRDEIEAAVEARTGRALRIGGGLELELFPWLAVRTGRVELADAPGFGAGPFAAIERAEVRVRLLPLLRRELEVGRVRVEGLRLHLRVDGEGRSNWADLAGGGGAAEGAGGGEAAPALALAVAGLEVRDARIEYVDEQAGHGLTLGGLELETGPLRPGAAVPVRLRTGIEAEPAGLQGRLEVGGEVTVDEALQGLRVRGLDLRLHAAGAGLPDAGVDLGVRGDLAADGAAGRLVAEGLELELPGLLLAGRAEAAAPARAEVVLDSRRLAPAELLAALGIAAPLPAGSPLLAQGELGLTARLEGARLEVPRLAAALGPVRMQARGTVPDLAAGAFEGRVEIAPFSPRAVLGAAGVEVPETADPAVLGEAALRTALRGDAAGIELHELALRLDQTRVQGRLAVEGLARTPPALRFDLEVDAVDLDRYLPPQAAETAPPSPGTAAVGTAALPLEMLRALQADGRVRIGRLKAFGIRSEAVSIRIAAGDGLLRLGPNAALLYGGRYAGDVQLDVRGDAPVWQARETLTDVDVGALLRDAMGEERLQGRAEVALALAAEGADPVGLRRTVDGTARFVFRDGLVRGVNIAQLIREARARLEGRPVPKAEGPAETDFTELAGSAVIRDGILRNDDLRARSPLLRVAGAGTVDLPGERLDYLLRVKLVGTLEGQGGADLAALKGLEIPLRIRGPWAGPSFSVELDKVLAGKAKARLEAEEAKARARLEAEKAEARQRLEEKKRAVEEETRRKLEDKLKGLLR